MVAADDNKAIYFRFGTELVSGWDKTFDAVEERAGKVEKNLEAMTSKPRRFGPVDTSAVVKSIDKIAEAHKKSADKVEAINQKLMDRIADERERNLEKETAAAEKAANKAEATAAKAAEREAAAAQKHNDDLARDAAKLNSELSGAYEAFEEKRSDAAEEASDKSKAAIEHQADAYMNSLGKVGHAFMEGARGAVYWNAVSQDSLDVMLKMIARFEAVYSGLRGGYDLIKGSTEAYRAYKEMLAVVAVQEAATGAARTAASGAGLAGSVGTAAAGGVARVGLGAMAAGAAGSAAAGAAGSAAAGLGGAGLGAAVAGFGAAAIGALAPLAAPVAIVALALTAVAVGAYELDHHFGLLGGYADQAGSAFIKGAGEFWEGSKAMLGMLTKADKATLANLDKRDKFEEAARNRPENNPEVRAGRKQIKDLRDEEAILNYGIEVERAARQAGKSPAEVKLDGDTGRNTLAKTRNYMDIADAIADRDAQQKKKDAGGTVADVDAKNVQDRISEYLEKNKRLEYERLEIVKRTQEIGIDGLKKQIDEAEQYASKLRKIADDEAKKYQNDEQRFGSMDPLKQEQVKAALEKNRSGGKLNADDIGALDSFDSLKGITTGAKSDRAVASGFGSIPEFNAQRDRAALADNSASDVENATVDLKGQLEIKLDANAEELAKEVTNQIAPLFKTLVDEVSKNIERVMSEARRQASSKNVRDDINRGR